jgi:hypothetical protein
MRSVALVALFTVGPLVAQAPLPPVRDVNVRLVESEFTVHGLPEGLVLSDGRVAFADFQERRFGFADPTLAEVITVFDRLSPGALKMPQYPAHPFLGPGDTIYYPEFEALGLRVISPTGAVVRRITIGDRETVAELNSSFTQAQVSADGLVYYAMPMERRKPGEFSPPSHDSMFVVKQSLSTRHLDIIGIFHLPKPTQEGPLENVNGQRRGTTYWSAVESGDAMAMNSNGHLAVVRGIDFHVDWYDPATGWRSTPPANWPWKRYTDEEKRALVAERDHFLNGGNVFNAGPAGAPPVQIVNKIAPPPDVEPAFVPTVAIPDRQGRIWVRIGARFANRIAGPPTYAAIDEQGQIVDRIRLPGGRTLIGFDKLGRVVALTDASPFHFELYKP